MSHHRKALSLYIHCYCGIDGLVVNEAEYAELCPLGMPGSEHKFETGFEPWFSTLCLFTYSFVLMN